MMIKTIKRVLPVLLVATLATSVPAQAQAQETLLKPFILAEKGAGEVSTKVSEVKQKLNRPVIGQIIAGSDMFERQYSIKPARCVILCSKEDSALQWVCEKRGIHVEKIGVD